MKTFKWTEQQKKALRGSIRKWQRIVNGTGIDKGMENCPCCRNWYINNQRGGCEGCPIKTFTGLTLCRGTPCDIDTNDEKIDIAELNFLRAVYLAGGGK